MKQFVDRELERKTLERAYARKDASLVNMYGRRLVGKTTLLNEYIRDKKSIYFLATQEAERVSRNLFRDK